MVRSSYRKDYARKQKSKRPGAGAGAEVEDAKQNNNTKEIAKYSYCLANVGIVAVFVVAAVAVANVVLNISQAAQRLVHRMLAH